MLLKTKHFGEIDIKDSSIIDFINGIPGFEKAKKYTIIENEDKESPFKWIQGVDNTDLAFVIVNPFAIKKNYEINLDDETLKKLEIKETGDVAVYSIVVVPENLNDMTMNLQAPLIINTSNNRGKQLILDTDRYGVRHYILEELQGREESSDASVDEKKGPINYNK